MNMSDILGNYRNRIFISVLCNPANPWPVARGRFSGLLQSLFQSRRDAFLF
jgi:hypothetical protein